MYILMIRRRNINWGDLKYTLLVIFVFHIDFKTFEVTVQWMETNLLQTPSKTSD